MQFGLDVGFDLGEAAVKRANGFLVEARQLETVDDENEWVVTHMVSPSIWGHKPGAAGPPTAQRETTA